MQAAWDVFVLTNQLPWGKSSGRRRVSRARLPVVDQAEWDHELVIIWSKGLLRENPVSKHPRVNM